MQTLPELYRMGGWVKKESGSLIELKGKCWEKGKIHICKRVAAAGQQAAQRSHVRNVFSDWEQSIWITLNDSPLYSVLQLSASFSPTHQPLLKSASLQTYSSTYTFTCKAWRQKSGNVAERWFVLESHPPHSYQPLQKKRKASENRFQLDCFSSSRELCKNPIINRCLKTLEKCNNCCWTALMWFLRYSKPQNHAT